MAKCNSDSKMQLELKRLFEGECCALSYNDDEDWFDDEDEEFEFDPKGSNKWFDDALEQGLKEQQEMQRGPEMWKDEESKDEENKDEGCKDEKNKDEENTIVINIIF
jgi:hypothetical protein